MRDLAWVVDLDGCLCEHSYRLRCAQEYLVTDPLYWETYFTPRLIFEDGVNTYLAEALRTLRKSGISIIYLTGRPERTRQVTLDWFAEYHIPFGDFLIMRSDFDHSNAQIYKTKSLDDFFKQYSYQIVAGVSDKVIDLEVYKQFGIPGLLVIAEPLNSNVKEKSYGTNF